MTKGYSLPLTIATTADTADGPSRRTLQAVTERAFLLPRHVHACLHQDSLIFLDLKHDKYFGLPPESSCIVATLLGASYPHANSTAESDDETQQLIDNLVQCELLTQDKHAANATPLQWPRPERPVLCISEEPSSRRPIVARDIGNFVYACLRARWALRWRSLHFAVDDAISRKFRNVHAACSVDTTTLAQLVHVFSRLRLYAFTAKGHCLFHALALCTFLARYGVFPTWTIGVRTNPFRAHSWVQYGHFSLDSTPEEVAAFTPILSI